MQFVQELAPAALHDPAGHEEHEPPLRYYPAVQETGQVFELETQVPLAQTQAVLPMAEDEPATQDEQAAREVAPVAAWKVFTGH